MGKVIKHVSGLPEWFSLGKYKNAQLLDYAGWHTQLSVRSYLRSLLYFTTIKIEAEDDQLCSSAEDDKLYYSTVSSRLRDIPIWEESADDYFEISLGAARGLGISFASVKEMRVGDLVNLFESSPEEVKSILTTMHQNKTGGDECDDFFEKWADLLFDSSLLETVGDSPFVFLKINLSSSDEILFEQFKLELARLRDEEVFDGRPAAKVNKEDFVRFSILPYMDLILWAEEVGVKIPNRVMADAIFSPGEGGEEVVRKTTSRLAGKALRDDFIDYVKDLSVTNHLKNGT